MKYYVHVFYILFSLIISNAYTNYENYDYFTKDYIENKKLFKFKWLMNPEAEDVPEQGWKIHISCSIEDLGTIIPPVVDKLLEKNIWFKIPSDINHINILYQNPSQLGKIITIYCKNSFHAVETATWLDQELLSLLNNFSSLGSPIGIQNPTELKIGESGFLMARYGKLAFKEEKVTGRHYITENAGRTYTLAIGQSSAWRMLKVLDENKNQIYLNEIPVWTLDDKTSDFKPYFIKEDPFSKAGLKVIFPTKPHEN